VRHHLDPVEQQGLAALIITMRKVRLGPGFATHRQPTAGERVLAVRAALRAFAAIRTPEVDLTSWGLEAIPEEVGGLVCTKLELSKNPLLSLPDAIGSLPSLRVLHASSTRLSALPPSFAGLRLSDLSLRRAQFSQFPAELLAIPTLTSLDLSDNPLARLPDALTDCVQLQWLSLEQTSLGELPPGIERLTQLKTLHLGGTPLAAAGRIDELQGRLPWCEITEH
jgi:Leucine-rich repeat (LRR) protein